MEQHNKSSLLQDDPDDPKDVLSDFKDVYDKFNQRMKKMFQNSTIQELFPHDGLLTELCTILLKEVKQDNPLKWVNHATSASTEVNELIYWKDQMKQDIDSIMSQSRPSCVQVLMKCLLRCRICSKKKKMR